MFFDFFFFKQKTAYEMRISDWSSDVCSSDLPENLGRDADAGRRKAARQRRGQSQDAARRERREARTDASYRRRETARNAGKAPRQIGRASCRERVCQYV